MASLDILYLVLIVSVVVITVTIVWLANDTRGLIKSLRRSADDTAVVTKEIREKVLMVSEALDRAGAAATAVIGMIETAIDEIKEKRDAVATSIGLLTGAGKAIKERQQAKEMNGKEEKKEEDPKNDQHSKGEKVEMPVKKETKLAKESKKDDSKPTVDTVAKPVEKKKEEETESKEELKESDSDI